jgi:hypothetical protein
MQRYLHKILSASGVDEAVLNTLGKDGWCLTTSAGDRLFLVKIVDVPPHKACGDQHCANCGNFPEKSQYAVAKCQRWGVSVQGSGGSGCDTYMEKQAVVVADTGTPTIGPKDDPSAWHWQPRTEDGEKRVEAITTQDTGVVAPSHKHRVLVIRSKDGKVVRGKTDMVNGHYHGIMTMGMTEEADGHTHTFDVSDKAR